VKVVAFDKTGTLTVGQPQVTAWVVVLITGPSPSGYDADAHADGLLRSMALL